jgi:hypothetical protein
MDDRSVAERDSCIARATATTTTATAGASNSVTGDYDFENTFLLSHIR